jgi:hypothetical protein
LALQAHPVVGREFNELEVFLQFFVTAKQKVLVLQRGRWLGNACGLSVDERAFQIENVRQFLWVFKLHCVLH